MKSLHDLRVLLMQVRLDQETLAEEKAAFAEYAGLTEDQVETLNIFETPAFDPSILESYDALFVGGSSDEGDALIVRDKPAFAVNSMHVLRAAYEQKLPVFASCYGFQAAVVALGGELVHDATRAEAGTPAIHLTDEGRNDPLFHGTPSPFHAVAVHEKLAAWLPEGAVTLAETERCPHHAFRFPDRPFYAFQFHPEVDLDEFARRLKRYQERYLASDAAYNELTEQALDTAHAQVLLGSFMERILLPWVNE